jgi:uncharacterized membrane protein
MAMLLKAGPGEMPEPGGSLKDNESIPRFCYCEQRMRYALPILVVAMVIPAFFALGQRGFASFGRWQKALAVLMALLLLGAAMEHFLRPELFEAIIPPVFPFRGALVLASGFCEAAGAIGLLLKTTQRPAALCIALLMVAVFPANIYVAGRAMGELQMPGVMARGAMQMIFILLVLLAGWGIPVLRKRRPDQGAASR